MKKIIFLLSTVVFIEMHSLFPVYSQVNFSEAEKLAMFSITNRDSSQAIACDLVRKCNFIDLNGLCRIQKYYLWIPEEGFKIEVEKCMDYLTIMTIWDHSSRDEVHFWKINFRDSQYSTYDGEIVKLISTDEKYFKQYKKLNSIISTLNCISIKHLKKERKEKDRIESLIKKWVEKNRCLDSIQLIDRLPIWGADIDLVYMKNSQDDSILLRRHLPISNPNLKLIYDSISAY